MSRSHNLNSSSSKSHSVKLIRCSVELGTYFMDGPFSEADPCGTAEDWLLVALSLRLWIDCRRTHVTFLVTDNDSARLFCTGSSLAKDNVVIITKDEAIRLADEILETLARFGDPCMFKEYDPIAMGC